jgi:hypothetical protein
VSFKRWRRRGSEKLLVGEKLDLHFLHFQKLLGVQKYLIKYVVFFSDFYKGAAVHLRVGLGLVTK